jgi:hypothetical protein
MAHRGSYVRLNVAIGHSRLLAGNRASPLLWSDGFLGYLKSFRHTADTTQGCLDCPCPDFAAPSRIGGAILPVVVYNACRNVWQRRMLVTCCH